MRKEQLIENDRKLTQQDIKQLEAFADKLFARVGIDVEFTRHFLQRVNDERNKKQITMAELTRLFKQEFKRWGKPIAKLGPDTEAIMKDMRTDINMPFALELNSDNELDLIAKTIMRKKDFKSNAPGEPEFKIESKDTKPLDVYTPTIKELQKKYDVKMKDLTAQIDKGVKVEMEHTNDPKVALEIALDHINEDLFYYSKLAKVEERLFPGTKKVNEGYFSQSVGKVAKDWNERIRTGKWPDEKGEKNPRSHDKDSVGKSVKDKKKVTEAEGWVSGAKLVKKGGQLGLKFPKIGTVFGVGEMITYGDEDGYITGFSKNGTKVQVEIDREHGTKRYWWPIDGVEQHWDNRRLGEAEGGLPHGVMNAIEQMHTSNSIESVEPTENGFVVRVGGALGDMKQTARTWEHIGQRFDYPVSNVNVKDSRMITFNLGEYSVVALGLGQKIKYTFTKSVNEDSDPMNPTVGNYDLDTLQRKVARDFAQMAEEASKAKSRREWDNIMHQLSNNTMYQLEDILDTYETLQARYSKGGPNSRGIDKSRLESVSDVEEGIFNPIDSAKKFANDMIYSGRNMDVAIELMHKIITKKGTDAKRGIGYYADKVARQFPEDTINVRALIDAYKALYGMNERKLTGGEKRSKESHFKKLKKHKGDFEKRYGKDAESVMHGVATKRAKKESVDEAKGPCWDGYEKVPGKKDYEKGSCRKVKEYANMAEADEITIEGYDEIRGDLSVELSEAEYQGRKVELNKPMQGDVKKFKVYVKNDKGNVVKVNFGEKGAKIKKNNPERRKSFRARHNCDNPGPKWKARYWSCRKW